ATVALLAFLWDNIYPFVDPRPQVLLPMIASELLIGGLIGAMTRLYIEALRFIGAGMAMLIGFNTSGGTAIEEAEPQAPMAELIAVSALLLLFSLNFHHEIVRALISSYQVAPLDALFNPQAALVDVTDTL